MYRFLERTHWTHENIHTAAQGDVKKMNSGFLPGEILYDGLGTNGMK